jgi:hypothetical protein
MEEERDLSVGPSPSMSQDADIISNLASVKKATENDVLALHDPAAEETAEMPPGTKRGFGGPKREADLSSLLTAAEKNDVISLITKITDDMQVHISQAFDSTGVGDTEQASRPELWNKLPAHLKDTSLGRRANTHKQGQIELSIRPNQKENVKPSNLRQVSVPDDAVPSLTLQANDEQSLPNTFLTGVSTGHKDLKQSEWPAGETARLGPMLQELSKEAIQHFKKWQATVVKRLGDISVKPARRPNNGPQSQLSTNPVKRGTSGNTTGNHKVTSRWLYPY